MPAVRLTYYECLEGLLPPVCVACGQPSETAERFLVPSRWFMYAVGVLSSFCPPLLILMVKAYAQRWAMPVPFCDLHWSEYKRWDRMAGWTYILWVGGAYVAAIVLFILYPDWWEMIVPGYFAAAIAWMAVMAVQQTRHPRTTEATAWGIRLSGVHADFVRAVHEDRAKDPNPDRLAGFGDLRDDYDDERA
jgi:hypothetical protein